MIVVSKSDKLYGTLNVSGAKNAVLPILAACIATDGINIIKNVPNISDVKNMINILQHLGCSVDMQGNKISVNCNINRFWVPDELINKLRASFVICGPMLAKFGKIKISLPGGCRIGARPVDLHLKGFKLLGADIEEGNGFIKLFCKKLRGNKICLDFPSVGATENLMIAASLAVGTTHIINAATEPEIHDLSKFLCSCGAKIKGAGTKEIIIEGVEQLKASNHSVMADRIEAGTYMIAASVTGGEVQLDGINCEFVNPLISKLTDMGVCVIENNNGITVKSDGKLESVNIKTMPHPGFPTDMQSQFCSMLCNSKGTGIITETVFENRFMHVGELLRMHADICIEGRNAIITGVKSLVGCDVTAHDLRSGAALVIAGLCAQGTTRIFNEHYIERGYDNFVEKLKKLGADIYVDSI